MDNFQVTATFGEESMVFDGSFMDKSVEGKINSVVEATFKSSLYDIKFHSGLSADITKGHLDAKVNFNGEEYTLLIEGTRSSLTIDINAIKHILIEAFVSRW